MKRITYHILAALALVAMTSVAYAQTPNPNGVAYDLRVFNDCPASTLTETPLSARTVPSRVMKSTCRS